MCTCEVDSLLFPSNITLTSNQVFFISYQWSIVNVIDQLLSIYEVFVNHRSTKTQVVAA